MAWRPPRGMKCQIHSFEPRPGGKYLMAFEYIGADHDLPGKTTEHADVIRGRFVELVPDQRIVEAVEFVSEDPAFSDEMTITTTLAEVPDGTKVTILCENVPVGIRPGDHEKGITSSLENLAAFIERKPASQQLDH